jgi:seryl-tRNA synthetase
MLDLKIIRQNPELVKDVIKKRNLTINLDEFLALDTQKNMFIKQIDDLREIKNKLSKEIPTLSPEARKEKIEESKTL